MAEYEEKVVAFRGSSKRDDGIGSPSLDGSGGGGHDSGMDDTWRAKVNERLGKLESGVEGLSREVRALSGDVHSIKGWMTGFAVAATAIIAFVTLSTSFAWNTSAKVDAVAAKVDAATSSISATLRQEFSAMRSEMSAQTSTVANSITATKQQAPQVILVPALPPAALTSPK